MILPRSIDAVHKAQLYRLLIAIIDDKTLAKLLCFKGGTCASMLGWLDRFSVDLDFDLVQPADKTVIRKKLSNIFKQLGMSIKNQSKNELFYNLFYKSNSQQRNSLKLSIVPNTIKSNRSQIIRLSEIDRYCRCLTIESMFANKLVAPIDRYQKYKTIAGRDIYDLDYFFNQGYKYRKEIIEERTKLDLKSYLKKLISFIEKNINLKIIDQDLNLLLAKDKFMNIRKILKNEVLMFLNDELKRLKE